MLYTLNVPSTIQALAQFVQVLDQHHFGAGALIAVIVAAAVLILAARPASHPRRPSLRWRRAGR